MRSWSGRVLLAWALAIALVTSGRAAGDQQPPYSWEKRLRGDAIVLLGEVHDNAEQHRLRLAVLRRAFAAGWRPSMAMEQFDREHQADIERARAERPGDAGYLIEQAATDPGKLGGGWNWEYYRPYIALALEYELPLLAANLSRSDASKIVARGYAAVFDFGAVHSLGLDREPERLLASQENEIDSGHCHTLPRELLPAMARAQLARDAVMAATLREHAAQGAVLLAGNGHARRDIGVPRWLDPATSARTLAIGFLERGGEAPPGPAFDGVVMTAPAPRADPCAALRGPAARRGSAPRQ